MSPAFVCVVDDDPSVRESVTGLLRAHGYEVEAFESADAFVEGEAIGRAGCLVLDVGLPGTTGPDLQQQLGDDLAIVFITARTDPLLLARLRERGAVACLTKPFADSALLDAVAAAVERSRRET